MKKASLVLIIILAISLVGKAQCYVQNFGTLGNLTKTTGDANLDKALNDAKIEIATKFGINVDFYIYDDGTTPNAYAEPGHDSFDGLVAFGQHMLRERLWNNAKGYSSVLGIMAHEFGHVVQYKNSYSGTDVKQQELEADFLAGYYFGVKYFASASFVAFGQDLYSIGDFAFASKDHHGTPDERLNAMLAGSLLKDKTIDEAYTASLSYNPLTHPYHSFPAPTNH